MENGQHAFDHFEPLTLKLYALDALASGYRPTQEIRKAVINQTDGPVFFSVATNGNFAIYHATTNNANVNLDVSFPTT